MKGFKDAMTATPTMEVVILHFDQLILFVRLSAILTFDYFLLVM